MDGPTATLPAGDPVAGAGILYPNQSNTGANAVSMHASDFLSVLLAAADGAPLPPSCHGRDRLRADGGVPDERSESGARETSSPGARFEVTGVDSAE